MFKIYKLNKTYIEDWEKNINSVSSQDIKNLAQKIFDINNSVTGYLLKPKGQAGL